MKVKKEQDIIMFKMNDSKVNVGDVKWLQEISDDHPCDCVWPSVLRN